MGYLVGIIVIFKTSCVGSTYTEFIADMSFLSVCLRVFTSKIWWNLVLERVGINGCRHNQNLTKCIFYSLIYIFQHELIVFLIIALFVINLYGTQKCRLFKDLRHLVDAFQMQCKLTHLIPRGDCKCPLRYYLRTLHVIVTVFTCLVWFNKQWLWFLTVLIAVSYEHGVVPMKSELNFCTLFEQISLFKWWLDEETL